MALREGLSRESAVHEAADRAGDLAVAYTVARPLGDRATQLAVPHRTLAKADHRSDHMLVLKNIPNLQQISEFHPVPRTALPPRHRVSASRQ
ncbi:hypothetical protein [Salinispora arenicola]|uniref:hypothetical protein n=1 Tax=Salinispora arenicola TaxID=168697 RepID=UPI0027DCA967|nr:hypothetical protein [Salinispora arenicola]